MSRVGFRWLNLAVVVLLLLPAVAAAEPVGPVVEEVSSGGEKLGDGQVSIAQSTGMARFVRLNREQAGQIARLPEAQGSLEAQALSFFEAYGTMFGVQDARTELAPPRVKTDQLGMTHLSYDQVFQGIPVFAGVLRVHFSSDGLITAVNGTFVPDISLNSTPSLGAGDAAQIAVAEILTRQPVSARSTKLYVFRENLARGIPGANHLVWEVEVGNGQDVREFVYIDAHSGKVVDQITGIYDALDRTVYNRQYRSNP